MNTTFAVTQRRTFLEELPQPLGFTITLVPSFGDDLTKYKCTVITLYSKEKSYIYQIDTNMAIPTELGNGILSQFDVDPTYGYLSNFNLLPEKDAVYKLGFTEFQLVTKVQYDAMVLANDYTLYLVAPSYAYMYGVYDSTDGSYRYFERVGSTGITMNNFTERVLNDFYEINSKDPDDTLNTTDYVNFVYKNYSEKSLITRLNTMINSGNTDGICNESCTDCGLLSNEIKAFVTLQAIYCLNLDQQFDNEDIERAGKLINLLKSLECCVDKC